MKRSSQERIELGDWAKSLSESVNYRGLIKGLVADTVEALMVTSEEKSVLMLHQRLLGIESLGQALQSLMNDGEMAKKGK